MSTISKLYYLFFHWINYLLYGNLRWFLSKIYRNLVNVLRKHSNIFENFRRHMSNHYNWNLRIFLMFERYSRKLLLILIFWKSLENVRNFTAIFLKGCWTIYENILWSTFQSIVFVNNVVHSHICTRFAACLY